MKLKNIHRGAGIALAALLVSVALSTSAQAVILAPNATASPVPSADSGGFGGGGTVAIDITTPFTTASANGGFSGTLRQVVTFNPDGAGPALTGFYYVLTLNSPTANPPLGLDTVNIFGNTWASFNSDVFSPQSLFGTVGVAPFASVKLNNAANTYQFDLANASVLGPTTTYFMGFHTTAKGAEFTGSAGILGGGSTVSVPIYVPSDTPIPEPTTALFGLALVGFVGTARMRRNRATV